MSLRDDLGNLPGEHWDRDTPAEYGRCDSCGRPLDENCVDLVEQGTLYIVHRECAVGEGSVA